MSRQSRRNAAQRDATVAGRRHPAPILMPRVRWTPVSRPRVRWAVRSPAPASASTTLRAATAYQERTGDAYQARVNGLYESAATIAPGIGFALGRALTAFASPRAVYMVAGVGGLAVLTRAAARLRDAD